MKTLIAKLKADIQLPDSYAELSKNIGYYGKYLTEAGEYMCMFSDGSGGEHSFAQLSITAYGFKIYGPGPGVYLKDGELSATHRGDMYHRAYYIYTLLEDGRVKVQEDGKVHYIVPKN